MLNHLSFDSQKDLLIKGWMSHDARWYMAVAEHLGIEAANRLNQRVGPCGDETVHESSQFATIKKYGRIPEP
jgi:hypothetical protein